MSYGAIEGLGTLLFGSGGDKVFGKKLVTPKLRTLEEAQKEAVAANTRNFADIAGLATKTNTLNQDQLDMLIDRTLPGARQAIEKNLLEGLRGEIPLDVQRAAYRATAAHTAGSNAFGGGGFTRNQLANTMLGTSQDIFERSLKSAEQWLDRAKVPTWDAASMFITPERQYAANTDQFNRDLLAAKIAAAPDPAARGVFDSNMAVLGMVLSAYGGGPGYQNNYRQDVTTPPPERWDDSFGGGGGRYLPQNFGSNYGGTSAGFGTPYTGGLAGASQSAGASNPYSMGGYSYGGGGGLGKLF